MDAKIVLKLIQSLFSRYNVEKIWMGLKSCYDTCNIMPEVYHSVMNGGYLIMTNGSGDHQTMAEPEAPPTWRFYIPKDVRTNYQYHKNDISIYIHIYSRYDHPLIYP